MNLIRLLAIAALLVAQPLSSDAVPIPPAGAALARVFGLAHTPRKSSIPHQLRRVARELTERVHVPTMFVSRREDREDIFLARSLEDTVFASARDVQDGVLQRRDGERTSRSAHDVRFSPEPSFRG
ncbi:hypothetical protein FB45DRAFT_907850 [Roridomyces roridus]|uniref:Uncharacterized protein n=1 Tax=Roridomyces roridus TaxID=1738132 RepID=A0AAD7FQ51_9AGAR|nr:hypothetical protein FB45DRAFT_907850 [Roridomyces roridus]